ncbi:MAG: alginate export family protein [Planctomycetota bacterium]|nr:alginate export family protein [Planctomycetota bacterium]
MFSMGWRNPLLVAACSAVILGVTGLAIAQQTPAPVAKAPAVAPAPAAAAVADKDWTDDWKQPTSWFKWGADERLRQEYVHNPFFYDTNPPGNEWNFNRIRTRVWGTVSPCDQFEANIRLTNEIRYWWTPASKPDAASDNDGPWDWSDIVFDNLNIKFKNLFDTKSALTIGRQDIILGDGWLVLEGTPLDGSRTIYFDAARFNIDLPSAKSTVDLIFIQQYSDPDAWLPAMNSRSYPLTNEQDQTGAILYVTNKSLENTQIDGYFIYKHSSEERAELIHDGTSGGPTSDQGDVYTVGTRVVHNFNKNWVARAEGAYQFGSRNNPSMFGAQDNDLSAWGMTSRVTYKMNDDWNNQFWAGLEMLSGDDPNSGTNTQFDPLWGRWPQFSELYVYPYASETRIAETTNLIRPNVGWSANPDKKIDLIATYQPMWAFENTRHDQGSAGFGSDDFRGHLVTAMFKYKFNKHMAGHLLGEYFFTGDFYEAGGSRNEDDIAYVRGELVFSF